MVIMLQFKKEDIIIHPKVHKYTLVFLPGWSRSAKKDLNVFKTVPFIENMKIIILQPPHRQVLATTRSLPSWFMIDLDIPSTLIAGLNETSRLVDEILQEEYDLCPNIFLGGFSQGGVTALYTGLVTSKIPLCGIFALSCFIPPAKWKEDRKKIPLFIYHGNRDEIVPYNNTRPVAEVVFKDFNFTFENDPGLGHTYSWKEFIVLKKWMKKCLYYEKL